MRGLVLRLDALCHQAAAGRPREVAQACSHGLASEVAVHVAHEADVELEVSGRELDDVLHARETGARVVDREVDPERTAPGGAP